MKKLSITSATFLVLTSASTLALAAPVDTTNFTTFAPNTPAVADEVNKNFDAIKSAVDANDTTSAAHAADTAAHHSKYTDAEAGAEANLAVGAHTAVPDAHHIRYSDGEASAAIKAADGTGSNLDADMLDGLDSTDFSAAGHTHVEADITDLGACPGDMVAVGSICIDKYEAYVTTTPTGSTAVNPVANVDCSVNGTNCTAVYAQSLPAVTPSTNFTWFQAQQACANVGKRLPTNAEWQMAAAGTPNPVTGAECVVDKVGIQVTGSIPGCISNYDALDMVGNVLEWVADWVPGSGAETIAVANANFGGDRITAKNAFNQGTGANMPAAILRGGSQFTPTAEAGVFFYAADSSPAIQSPNVGFRCAK